ncbi:hypothetical protein BN1723_019392, partial [Verticillium longisporum]
LSRQPQRCHLSVALCSGLVSGVPRLPP